MLQSFCKRLVLLVAECSSSSGLEWSWWRQYSLSMSRSCCGIKTSTPWLMNVIRAFYYPSTQPSRVSPCVCAFTFWALFAALTCQKLHSIMLCLELACLRPSINPMWGFFAWLIYEYLWHMHVHLSLQSQFISTWVRQSSALSAKSVSHDESWMSQQGVHFWAKPWLH